MAKGLWIIRLEFKGYSLGFEVQGSGFRVQCEGFRVEGLVFRLAWFRVSNFRGFRAKG